MRRTLFLLLSSICLTMVPMLALGQPSSTAKMTLDGSGYLVLSSKYFFVDTVPFEYYEGNPWNLTDSVDDHFMYIDIRMDDFESNYNSDISDLDTRFPNDQTLYVVGNGHVLQDAYFMGLYDFGSSDFGANSATIPEFDLTSANTYFSTKTAGFLTNVANGTLDLRMVLKWDPATFYNAYTVLLEDSLGTEISNNDDPNQDEMGVGTGKWISTGTSANIETHGFVTGNYEAFVYTEFHETSGTTNARIISAYQEFIGYTRFTLIDENTALAPAATITKSTTYLGEADLVLGADFEINSGGHVDFIVSNGNSIIFDDEFHARLGGSFTTELNGGTSLAKGGGDEIQFDQAGEPADGPDWSTPARPYVFPNPTSGNATIVFDLPDKGSADITIFDMLGRKVGHTNLRSAEAGTNHLSLNRLLGGLSPNSGQYYIRIETSHGIAHTSLTFHR